MDHASDLGHLTAPDIRHPLLISLRLSFFDRTSQKNKKNTPRGYARFLLNFLLFGRSGRALLGELDAGILEGLLLLLAGDDGP